MALEARLLKEAGRGKVQVGFATVMRAAMESHFEKQHGDADAVIYAAPRSCLSLQPLDEALHEAPTKRARAEAAAVAAAAAAADGSDVDLDIPVDLDVEAGSVDASAGFHVDLVYFQVTITAPSNKRVVRVPIAAGGRVRKGVAVSVREQLGAASGDQAVVASAAVATQDLADPVHILNLRANLGDLVQLRLSLVRWSSKRMRWHTQNIDHLGLNQQALNAMLHEMVALGAFACNSDSLGFTPTSGQLNMIQHLRTAGLVQPRGGTGDDDGANPRWFFTDAGAQRLRTAALPTKPQQVFALRVGEDLEQLTVFELVMTLRNSGWQWELWVPPSGLTRRVAGKFTAYAEGQPKIWYSGMAHGPRYMMALLRAETLFQQGLEAIPHGPPEKQYASYLQGDLGSLGALDGELPRELDADDAAATGLQPDKDGHTAAALVPEADLGTEFFDDFEEEERSTLLAEIFGPDSGSPDAVGDVTPVLGEATPAPALDVEGVAFASDDAAAALALRRGRPLAIRSGSAWPLAAADEGQAPSSLEGGVPPAPPPIELDADDFFRREPPAGQFGVFRGTPKQPGKAGPFGGYQVTCPLHRKSARTGCKRFMTLPGPSMAEKMATLRLLM